MKYKWDDENIVNKQYIVFLYSKLRYTIETIVFFFRVVAKPFPVQT